ncbi:hypothetical protein HYALB_00000913 [Hymenoscyphus albidus]|uniref:F-box domain-containing protein n=1 Tax=Hymenoscyphus albidus TaxID=595503 RepID=A0A9N9PQ49_9HELO|nr:hypothetical protein HYALB_00000913 [Hymenoscyphus albidus]
MAHDDRSSEAPLESSASSKTVEPVFEFTHVSGRQIASEYLKSLLPCIGINLDGSVMSGFEHEAAQGSRPIFGSNPEVVSRLQELWEFREIQEPGGGLGKNHMLCAGELFPPSRSECSRAKEADYMHYSSTAANPHSFYQTQPSHLNPNRQYSLSPQFSVLTRPPSAEPQTSSFEAPNSHNNLLTVQSCNTSSASYLSQPRNNIIPSGSNSHSSVPHLPSPTSAFLASSSTGQFANSIQLPQLNLPPIERTSPLQPNSVSPSCPKLPSIVHTSQQASHPPNQLNNIKSFMPVNKPVNQTNNAHNNSNLISNTTIPNFPANFSHYLASQGTKADSDIQDRRSSLSNQASSAPHSNPLNSVIQRPKPQNNQLPKTFDLTSSNFHITTLQNPSNNMVAKKRKSAEEQRVEKRAKLDKKGRSSKKEVKPESARERIGQDIWMRIFEFTPPSFLKKARLVCKTFQGIVDQFDSIFVNCRKENYGWDMPPPPPGMSEREYSDLLGGKGCQTAGCQNKKASRAYWSWAKRWCSTCWEKNVIREDRVIKQKQNEFGRNTVVKMLESIPAAVHDSFIKPHDYTVEVDVRSRGPPRLYKCYLESDVDKIIEEYKALTPLPHVPNPSHTPQEAATAAQIHKDLMDGLEEKQNAFFAEKKTINDEHMAKVCKIEQAVRNKRLNDRKPNDKNRKARSELFSRRATEELKHIPIEFVQKTVCFKAATRIYRDPGSERGWRALKPKIEAEWNNRDMNPVNSPATKSLAQLDGADDDISAVDEMEFDHTQIPSTNNPGSQQLPNLHFSNAQHNFRQSNMLLQPARTGSFGYANAYSNSLGFGYSTSTSASLSNALGHNIHLSFPHVGNVLPRPLNNFSNQQTYHPQFAYPLGRFTQQQNSHVTASTQIPIGSLLRPSSPATRPKQN